MDSCVFCERAPFDLSLSLSHYNRNDHRHKQVDTRSFRWNCLRFFFSFYEYELFTQEQSSIEAESLIRYANYSKICMPGYLIWLNRKKIQLCSTTQISSIIQNNSTIQHNANGIASKNAIQQHIHFGMCNM